MEGHDHSIVVAGHQTEEEMMEGAADRGLLDIVAAAWVPPPDNEIKHTLSGGLVIVIMGMKRDFAFHCSMNFTTQTTNRIKKTPCKKV